MAWLQIQTRSDALKMPVDFQVLLPQFDGGGTGKGSASTPGPYKALYLLHGLGGSGTEWLRNSAIEYYMRNVPMAVILPDGHNSFWSNMKTGKRYLDYITEELPSICEGWFNLSKNRDDRYIAGLSMGGFGTLNAALNRPDMFSKAAALCPVTDIIGFFKGRDDITVKQDWIFGDDDEYLAGGSNPYQAIDNLIASGNPAPDFLITCGEGDGFYGGAKKLAEHMSAKGISSKFHGSPGVHDWEYADETIKYVLSWLGAEKEA